MHLARCGRLKFTKITNLVKSRVSDMDPEALVQIWHNVQFGSYLLFLIVKQAEYKRTVSPLFSRYVLSRPQQQGVFHFFLLPVLLSLFSHKDTEAVSPFSLHPFLNPNVSSLLLPWFLFLSFFFLLSHYFSWSLLLPLILFLLLSSLLPSSMYSCAMFFNFLCMKDSSDCFNNK